MIKEILFVGAGGFLGSAARFLISELMRGAGRGFPWATLCANLLGCLLIGLFYGIANRTTGLSANTLLFLTTGFCGGFTTFSTFSKEGLSLLQTGSYGAFLAYVLASVVVGLMAVALGFWLTK
ncbi:MAG: fluoride efflux transporter CrcB [Prevotella sp.]|nr:fluoride efflux transporter CrcB [Prevotella sp.]